MRRDRGRRTYTSAGVRVVASLVLALATLPLLAASGTAEPGTPSPSPSASAPEQAPLSTLTVSTVDSSDTPVAGVGFAVWQESNGVRGLQREQSAVSEADTDLRQECTTGGDGRCTVGEDAAGKPALAPGTYYWLQTDTPDGYQAPADEDQPRGTVTVTADNAGTDLSPTVVTLAAVPEQDAEASSQPTSTEPTATEPSPAPTPQESGGDDTQQKTTTGDGSVSLLASLAPQQVTVSCVTGTGDIVGGVEIDGDLCAETDQDWDSPVGSTVTDGFDDATGFTGGSSESKDPSTWTIGGSPNPKSDIGTPTPTRTWPATAISTPTSA